MFNINFPWTKVETPISQNTLPPVSVTIEPSYMYKHTLKISSDGMTPLILEALENQSSHTRAFRSFITWWFCKTSPSYLINTSDTSILVLRDKIKTFTMTTIKLTGEAK